MRLSNWLNAWLKKKETKNKKLKINKLFMDAILQADLDAVAKKDSAVFKVTVETAPVAPPPPVVETVQFTPDQPPTAV